MPAAIAPVAGAVVGGLMSGDSESSNTVDKKPWEAAEPWLRQNLQTGQDLQNYYQKNPFNPQQRAAYQNLFSDADHFRQNTAPGMMQFANRFMNTNYQRSPQSNQGAPWMQQGGIQGNGEPMRYGGQGGGMQVMQGGGLPMQGGGQQVNPQGGGLLGAMNQMKNNMPSDIMSQLRSGEGRTPMQDGMYSDSTPQNMFAGNQGSAMVPGSSGGGDLSSFLQSMRGGQGGMQGGPFNVAQGTPYGLIDWDAQNPFSAQNKPPEPVVKAPTPEEKAAAEAEKKRKAKQELEDRFA